jgi:hypothetical protein
VEGLCLHKIAGNFNPIHALSEIGTSVRSVRSVQGRTLSRPCCYRDWQNLECINFGGLDERKRETSLPAIGSLGFSD